MKATLLIRSPQPVGHIFSQKYIHISLDVIICDWFKARVSYLQSMGSMQSSRFIQAALPLIFKDISSPFDVGSEEVSLQQQIELIDFQCSDNLKSKFLACHILDFLKSHTLLPTPSKLWTCLALHTTVNICSPSWLVGWFVCWVLWHVNLCRLFNAKSIFMWIICSI